VSLASNAERVEKGDEGSAVSAVPTHVAIIMDGNGRWAAERGLSRTDGHRAGTENIRRILQSFAAHGVRYLTLFAFSTENWERPTQEVNALIEILQEMIRAETHQLHQEGVRLLHIGRLDRLPGGVRKGVADAIEMTRENTGITVALAYDYGGRSEMANAIKSIIADGVQASQIDEQLVSGYLYTAGMPDPDLIIRTAGEMRISNFLLWQAAYAEYYSTGVYWPDFDETEVDKAIAAYGQRRRKYGRVDGGVKTRATS
jgi:undecaprenyl diphosphate synthase